MKRKFLIIVLLCLLLVSCQAEVAPSSSFVSAITEKGSTVSVEIDWIKVNPPPGVEGPCYAFFIEHDASGYEGYGYGAVWCQ